MWWTDSQTDRMALAIKPLTQWRRVLKHNTINHTKPNFQKTMCNLLTVLPKSNHFASAFITASLRFSDSSLCCHQRKVDGRCQRVSTTPQCGWCQTTASQHSWCCMECWLYFIIQLELVTSVAKIMTMWPEAEKIQSVGGSTSFPAIREGEGGDEDYDALSHSKNYWQLATCVGTKFGHLAFSVAGPTAWNSLPDYLSDPSLSKDICRWSLRTYLFALYLSKQCIWGIASCAL